MKTKSFVLDFVRDFRNAVSLTLILIWVLAVWHMRTVNSFLYPLTSVILVTFFDLLITFARSKKFYLPYASWVSGLLIGLIIAPTEPFYVIIAASLLASLSKQFLGLGIRRHIFNPATFGIVAVFLIFGTQSSWWAVSWRQNLIGWQTHIGLFDDLISRPYLIIIILFMFNILRKLKRLFLPAGFLLFEFFYLLTLIGPKNAAPILFDGTVLLFSLVMLPEIITSPASGYFKYTFGIIVAVLAIVISRIGMFGDASLTALLLANLVTFVWIQRKGLRGLNLSASFEKP